MESGSCYLKATLFCLLCTGWSTLATVILGTNLFLSFFGKRIFAKIRSGVPEMYNRTMKTYKMELFAELNGLKPGEGRSKLRILEIGGGSGANFQYWTVPADVDVIEPNAFSIPYFEVTRQKFTASSDLNISPLKEGYGEDLKNIGIEDNSCDAVVMTQVLCSVTDQVKCIKEIQRVLRPGGKFFYMEHILANEGDFLRPVQNLFSTGGFWSTVFEGCNLNRDTPAVIEALGGWSKLNQRKFQMPVPDKNDTFLYVMRNFVRPHVMGIAEK